MDIAVNISQFIICKPYLNLYLLIQNKKVVSSHSKLNKVSAAGLLIALGIIYGDIGTSPLYVFNEILKGKVVNELLIIGGLSCITYFANHSKIRFIYS